LQVAAGVSHETSNSASSQETAGFTTRVVRRLRTSAASRSAAACSWARDAVKRKAWPFESGPARLALAGSLVSILFALLLAHGPFTAVQVLALLGAGLGLLSIHFALKARAGHADAAPAAELSGLGTRLEQRLEELRDLQWQLNENEQRCRALLDAQEDMILRRDDRGRLTFVNTAFLAMFGVTADEVMGKPFAIEACDGECPAPLSTTDELRHQRFTQQVLTHSGPRWITWEERLVPAGDGSRFEVQSVGRDVTDQRRAETLLAETRDQAEAANRAKSRFLAAMSHEIRTPMNGILGMASLLLETQQTPEQQTYSHAIDQSARTLLALIDEILDFSKIEAGKLELADVPFALETCVQGAVELLAPRAHEKGLEMAWSVDPQLPLLVSGDEVRVRQILLNLLSNAVKFTDTGGVSVNAVASVDAAVDAPDAVGVEIVVEDTGIGMSREDMQGLFAEFEQADAAIRRRDGGTGLGLAISMQLACAMGGEIRVVSAPGKGSTFKVVLALKQVAPVGADAPERSTIVETARVLLAFDRPLERRALSYALTCAGVPAAEADFGAAESLLKTAVRNGAPFDRIVVDGGEGAAAAGRLLTLARDLNSEQKVRGIVLVNVLARASLTEFRAAGFDAYLVRPVRPASMMMQLGLHGPHHVEPDAAASSSSPIPQAPGGGRRRRVLLAEDNEINSLLAKRVLEKCGCDYVAVSNGNEAVAAVCRSLDGEGPPLDLVLMDIFMPQLDGIEAARTIKGLYTARSGPGGSAPPIVALTASAFAEDKKRYLEAGMDDYLAKPFDKSGLEAVLKRWFGQTADGDTDAAA
jgi:PAS domain S-box-containing protein